MIANLTLFFLAIAKISVVCGFAPAIAIAILFEKFGAGAQRPAQSESGSLLGSNPRVVSDSLSASSKSSAGEQLASAQCKRFPADLAESWATRSPRKARMA